MTYVPPGSGWPEDPATLGTPVAHSAADVRSLASGCGEVHAIDARVSVCRACPRLVEWREQVADQRRRAFATETYWGRPVPGWGDEQPRVLIVGLAPAAHGGNRTGRIFTGDRSGDWLFAALYRAGLAVQATSVHAGDGQRLVGARVLATVRCAPPANAPTPEERLTCAPWLLRELELIRPYIKSVVALGSFAWQAAAGGLSHVGFTIPRPRPRFGHAVHVDLPHPDGGTLRLIGSYHPSQQNTFTGKLTAAMLDDVFTAAVTHAFGSEGPPIRTG